MLSAIDISKVHIYGRHYIVDKVLADFNKQYEELRYRIYVTDLLRGLCGGEGIPRWYDSVASHYETESTEDYVDERELRQELLEKLNRNRGC